MIEINGIGIDDYSLLTNKENQIYYNGQYVGTYVIGGGIEWQDQNGEKFKMKYPAELGNRFRNQLSETLEARRHAWSQQSGMAGRLGLRW